MAFNGVELVIIKDDLEHELFIRYAEMISEVRRMRRLRAMNKLMRELRSFDWNNTLKLFDATCEVFGLWDFGVEPQNAQIILDSFSQYGYIPNMNSSNDIDKNDEKKYLGYSIGTILTGIQKNNIVHMYDVIDTHIDVWYKKFDSRRQE